MPRNIPPKIPSKEVQSWDENQMKLAIAAIRNKTMGYKKAVKLFKVPRTTLRRLARDSTVSLEQGICKTLGRKPIFSRDLEEQLVKYLLIMEKNYFGLTYMDIRRLAYELAIKNNVTTPFKDGTAGRAWLDHFLIRHKHELTIEKNTTYRIHGGNWICVKKFFDMLQDEYSRKSYTPDRIYNVDVTGLTIAQSKIPTVIVRKGRTQIGALKESELEYLITVVYAMNAEGKFLPPMMIFPRTTFSDDMMKGAPPGATGRIHPSGWIQTNLFTDWFNYFLQETKPTENSPVILLLDGNYTHTRNLELFELAEKFHVTILSVPPYTGHKLNPLERTFLGKLRSQYTEELRKFIAFKNQLPQPSDIPELFGKAYMNCATNDVAVNGFKDTGIYPYKRELFVNDDFPAVYVENSAYDSDSSPFEHTGDEPASTSTTIPQIKEEISVTKTLILPVKQEIIETNEASTSKENDEEMTNNSDSEHLDSMDETEDETTSNNVTVSTLTDDQKGQIWVNCQSCNMWWAHDKSVGKVKQHSICEFCR